MAVSVRRVVYDCILANPRSSIDDVVERTGLAHEIVRTAAYALLHVSRSIRNTRRGRHCSRYEVVPGSKPPREKPPRKASIPIERTLLVVPDCELERAMPWTDCRTEAQRKAA